MRSWVCFVLLCEGKSQEIYGIGNKVIEYWGKKLYVCVCIVCIYRKRMKKLRRMSICTYGEERCFFWFVYLVRGDMSCRSIFTSS